MKPNTIAPVAPDNTPTVRQHNAITQARYDYSACQLDIFFYLLSCLRRDDEPNKVYEIYLKDIEALTGRQWNYQQMREATADMGSRMFEVEDEKIYKQLWMFQEVEYVKGRGFLRIQLAEPIRPYLFNLKENFTSYQLHFALKMSSKYAKRIYQLVSQWDDKPRTRIYPLDEFKWMLHPKDPKDKKDSKSKKDPKGKEANVFDKISHLKARVLDIAVRQISEHTDLKIGYELLKKGRAYEAVRFTIAHQTPQQQPIPFEQPTEDARIHIAQQTLEALGITQPQLVATILGDAKHLAQLFKFSYELKTDKIKANKNPGGLFLKICGLR